MGFVLFMLAISPVFANFADFLIGKRGDKALRDRLFVLYMAVEGDWRRSYQMPAQLLSDFLSRRLHAFSFTFIFYVVLYSIVISSAMFFFHVVTWDFDMDYFQMYFQTTKVGFWWNYMVLPNIVGDLISWTLSVLLLRRLSQASAKEAAITSIVLLATTWFTFLFVALLEISGSDVFWMRELSFEEFVAMVYDRSWRATSGALSELGLPFCMYTYDYWGFMPLVAVLPMIMLAVALLVMLGLLMAKPVLRGPAGLILQRIEGSSKNVLTLISLTVAGVAALILAWQKWAS